MPAVFQKTVEQDLHKPLKIQYCADTVFTKDNAGNQINVLLYEDGEPYNSGGTVSATAIRADGATESWAGTISGNTVSVALTRAALDVPGTLQVFIKVTSGTTETTVYAGVYNVVCTETPAVVAPVTPSDVAALIASIEAAIRNIPADWTSFLGTIAPTFEPDKAGGYAAGAYVWYPGQPDNVGTLYRFTSAHSGTWTGTDAVTVVIGNELNDTVRYTQQIKTDAEKTIARANIGAASAAEVGTVPTGETVEGQIDDLKSVLSTTVALTDDELYSAIDTYNDILANTQNTNFFVRQTSSTITSGYIRNGVLVENDRFSHTDYIPVRPNTQYTSCLVPAYGGATDPGYECATKVVFYDVDKTYISESEATTFTTPINCKYVVLNLGSPGAMNIGVVNARAMLVYGSSTPTNYVSPSETTYMDLREMFGDTNNAIQNLKQITTENGNEYSAVDAVSTSSGYRWYLASNGLVYGAATDNQTAKVFPIIAGRKYKVYGFGYDRAQFYVAVVSKYNIVASGQASIADPDAVNLLCGTDEYPAGYTYHTITFVAPYNGFVYVNSRTASDQPTASLANITVKTEEYVKEAIDKTYHKTGVYISNGVYYHFMAEGENNIIRKFERRGPNNLFQWDQILQGTVDSLGVHLTKEYSYYSTDIVGPISIWNGDLWPGVYGQWTGGNHGKNIDGVNCPTAEEVSFECTVNGVPITQDGLYYGDVRFNTVNNLYFAQSITENDLSNARLAIVEHRQYHLSDKMNVRVWLEIKEPIRVARYYGMQMADLDFSHIYCVNNGYYQKLSEMTDAVDLHKKERRIIFTKSDDRLVLEMDLHNIGIGEYVEAYNNDTIGYVTISNHGPTGTFKKTYYNLIATTSQPSIPAGTNLYWEGDYVLYYS